MNSALLKSSLFSQFKGSSLKKLVLMANRLNSFLVLTHIKSLTSFYNYLFAFFEDIIKRCAFEVNSDVHSSLFRA